MNIALEKTEEFVNGKKRRSYGDAFVRGNNGRFGLAWFGRAKTDGVNSDVYCAGLGVFAWEESWFWKFGFYGRASEN